MCSISAAYSQITTDTITADTLVTLPDSIHPFHRKKGDVLNYLVVDNFNNPALAGSLKSYQAQAGYRHLLPGSSQQNNTGQIMLDIFFGNKQGRHGLAYRMNIQHIGFATGIRQRIDYSFQCINKKNISLRAGVGIGFQMIQQTQRNFTYGDMIDPTYGFVYSSVEKQSLPTTAAFQVNSIEWGGGAQLRIFDGYLNVYNYNTYYTLLSTTGSAKTFFPSLGINALYNINFSKLQLIPSVQLNYTSPQLYTVQGGVFLASSTRHGGGGGLYYNSNQIFTVSGLFAWNDYLRIYAQLMLPTSHLRNGYPVSGFQFTVSYKINDFGKYE
jgi:hypothetical protein